MGEALKIGAPEVWTRERLEARRSAIAAAHRQGSCGTDIVRALTALTDDILMEVFREAVGGVAPEGVCLVALGGYGRRELSPYSDIDLMFLYGPDREEFARSVSTKVLHALWDLGFQVGHSLRTIGDCLAMGRAELIIRTSLMEARSIAGDATLFQQFSLTFREQVTGNAIQEFILQKLEERRREYGRFGATTFLLEPNLKKSRGGLRDLHLLKWVALARYGTPSFEALAERGVLATGDAVSIKAAQDFLWRIRNELHFHAGRAQDILTFDEQIRIAAAWGFQNAPHLLSVEQFMQQYYRHSAHVADVMGQFVSRAMVKSFWQRLSAWLPARQIETYFAITRDEITVPVSLRKQFLEDDARVLRLFQLGQIYGLAIADELLQDLSERLGTVPDAAFRSADACRTFLSMLDGTAPAADSLACMHRVRLLERMIPAFGPVRGLMQFNAYHKYTVDHHCLLALGQAETLGVAPGMLGQAYQEIKHKEVLYLAVLLHDLGKGQGEDHSVVGERIARETAARLGLGEHETRLLAFLVRHHLLMSNTAFRRDASDDKVVLRFAREVGTAEALKKLYVLTAADISAVGPDVFTKWKETLLSELYLKTLAELAREEGREATVQDRRRKMEVRKAVLQRLEDRLPVQWLTRQLEAWPDRAFSVLTVERIASHLEWLWRLNDATVLVDAEHHPGINATEYTVYTRDSLTPGIFSKIAGVLASRGVQILDAQIMTLADGVVVDVFHVLDPDYPEGPETRRTGDIRESIIAVLEGRMDVEKLLREATRFGAGRQGVPLREPTVVQVDNETSDRYTIIDVFADDRQGLLYVLTKTIFDLGLSVHAARTATHLDQAADVFDATDEGGHALQAQDRCDAISAEITTRIEQFFGGDRAGRPVVQRTSLP